jgi:hypothetical protein
MRHLDDAARMKEDALEDMQRAHEDQLNKLTALTKEREIAWNKQKEEIEAHYSQLLAEIQSRSKVLYLIIYKCNAMSIVR